MSILDLLQTPVNTLLVLAGIAIVFFTFFKVSKGSVELRKINPKSILMPVGIGAALILVGLLYKPEASTALPESTITPTTIPDTPTLTTIIIPDTLTPSPTATATATEPPTPTQTASPVPVKSFNDGCIAAQTWQPASIDPDALNSVQTQNYCWNLNSLGFSAETGGKLHLYAAPAGVKTASGIYTGVGDQSTIEFNVHVNKFYIVYEDNPGYISFSVAPQGTAMATKGSGRFKLQVKAKGNSPLILFVLADTTESSGTELGTQHYLYGRIYDIRLELKGIYMDVYINNVKLNQALTIPTGQKVFYIGYDLPLLASADIEITDLTVDGVKK